MNEIDNSIDQVWQVEQEILDVIHKVCVENNLRYTLIFGTLLGAVRHGGFIPWDDDIDILMPRDDYEKLISIWSDVAPVGYVLQNKRTDSDFTQNFTKIRKDNTAFIQDEYDVKAKYHKGIFVDIFPADKVAPKGISRIMQYAACTLNLLYSRGHISGTRGIIGIGERILLILPTWLQVRVFCSTEHIIARWNSNDEAMWFSPNTINVCKRYFYSELFSDMKTIRFNNKEYCCTKDPNALLTKIYGDYMKLPPEEDRVWKHHPMFIDFEHNYCQGDQL